MTIALVSCVVRKRPTPSIARDLYTSAWFRKASAYADDVSDTWYILSAKYGLLDLQEVIAPYDLTLNDMGIAQRRDWAKGILPILLSKFMQGDVAIVLAGLKYREFLVDPLLEIGVKVEVPMKGLRIGEQLQWLNRQLGIE